LECFEAGGAIRKSKKATSVANNLDGIIFCEISLWEIAMLSTDLFSDNNKDPTDRIIAATSIIENARLVTADKKLRQSSKVATIW